MAFFGDLISCTKEAVKRWADYSMLRESTVLRDVGGNISLLLQSASCIPSDSLEILRASLEEALCPFHLVRLYCEPDNTLSDLDRAVLEQSKAHGYAEEMDGDCRWYRLERTVAKKAWLDRSQNTEPIWPYSEAVSGAMPAAVSFYSFLGGTGRTTALAITSLHLAQQGRNVLLIDADLESPGLASLFFPEEEIPGGVVDYFLAPAKDRAANMSRYVKAVSDEALMDGIPGAIFVLPAGVVDEEYLQKLSRIDCQDTQQDSMRYNISRLVEDALHYIRAGPTDGEACTIDYILFDTGSGFGDMSGVITAQLSHGVVLFGRSNPSSWSGLKQVVSTLANAQREPLPIAIVNGMCSVDEYFEERGHFRSKAYLMFHEVHYSQTGDSAPGIYGENEPHVPIRLPYSIYLTPRIRLYSNGNAYEADRISLLRPLLLGADYQAIPERIYGWFGDSRSDL